MSPGSAVGIQKCCPVARVSSWLCVCGRVFLIVCFWLRLWLCDCDCGRVFVVVFVIVFVNGCL